MLKIETYNPTSIRFYLAKETYRFDELLGAVLPGEGDESKGLRLVVLDLVHRSNHLHNLEICIKDLRIQKITRPKLSFNPYINCTGSKNTSRDRFSF